MTFYNDTEQMQMASKLQSFTENMIPAVEAEMQEVLRAEDGAPTQLYTMMHYHMGWTDNEGRPARVKAGKRIRPLLLLLSCGAAGSRWQRALPAGAAVELLHNFTLIHDDIQDASPTRRGRDTVWKIWGVPHAINSGDSMFALAHHALYRLAERSVDAEVVMHAARRFDETCVALTQGQYRDMAFETRPVVTVAEYLEMIGGKTAALLALCGELGALIAGAEGERVKHYAAFSRDLGLAFQVKDDILGIWGDEEQIGKSAATDIETRKKTLPVLYGLERSEELRDLYAQAENDGQFVSRVVQLLNDCSAREFAREQAAAYSKSALEHLEASGAEGPAGTALHQLADRLLQRQE
ncbi:MAG: polyprenyl synthetase family protein [Candidatus Promineifilaceae bacterium]|nr:polyprenyl synthetase family protein [Candidatus Promineifilaceae bacterium]